jgi:dipeptidyl aminopeptidase/acylaminoacyl peptidase
MPSGEELLFARFDPSGPSVSSFRVRADGSAPAEALQEGHVVTDLTPDGRFAITTRVAPGESVGANSNRDLWLLPLSGEEEARPLLETSGPVQSGRLSPDGRWLVYESVRSEESQLYLTRFPEMTGRWQVSVEEGNHAFWDPRGGRLYYVEGSKLMEVTVGSGDQPSLGKPVELFEHDDDFIVSQDGESFLLVESVVNTDEDQARSGIKVVQNWIREFRK